MKEKSLPLAVSVSKRVLLRRKKKMIRKKRINRNLRKLEDFSSTLVRARELSAEQEANSGWEKDGEKQRPVTGR